MSERISNLERSILEMGAELFRLKHSVAFLASQNDQLTKLLQDLKEVLNDKGTISADDFTEALGVSDLKDVASAGWDADTSKADQLKKKTH